mgnify:CR=1 FL=1
MKRRKLFQKILLTRNNIRFEDLQKVIEGFNFHLDRVQGSHHIYVRAEIPELVNIQNDKGKAKPYQIKQFLSLVEKYNLKLEEE